MSELQFMEKLSKVPNEYRPVTWMQSNAMPNLTVVKA
jgi:hypothetical protein